MNGKSLNWKCIKWIEYKLRIKIATAKKRNVGEVGKHKKLPNFWKTKSLINTKIREKKESYPNKMYIINCNDTLYVDRILEMIVFGLL